MHVLDEVPVENTFIRTPVLLVGPAHCKMNCASDLLVEEDVLCESVDVEVHSNAKLSQSLGTIINIELFSEKILILFGGHIHNLAIFEIKMDAPDLSTQPDGWKVEVDFAVRACVQWSGEDLAAWNVVNRITDYWCSSFDRKPKICLLPDQSDIVSRFHQSRQFLHASVLRLNI